MVTDADLPVAPGWTIYEPARSRLISAHDLRGLRDSPDLTTITDFAAALCETPVALASVLEGDLQHFFATTGFDEPTMPRDTSFCTHAMLADGLLIVPDATRDPRFANNPLVTGGPGIRFYAGAPLLSHDGVPLGSLCVIDVVPREGLTPLQHQGLNTLAEAIMARLRDNRDATAWRASTSASDRALEESRNRFRVLADSMPQMVWSTLPDGYHDYYNARWYEFTGMPEGSTDGEEWNGMFHPQDQDRTWQMWRHCLASGDPYEVEYRLRHHSGDYRWTLGRALPLRDDSGAIVRWFGTCTDIHEQKQASEEREIIAQELSHRIKNIFAVVAGLIAFSARANPGFRAIADDLRERVTALGRAHDFVRPHSHKSRPAADQSSLHGLLDELFRPYQLADTPRILVTGSDVAIDDRSTTPLALLIHELATNATKYGALSRDGGEIGVDIARHEDSVIVTWTERAGPVIERPPETSGFGSQLIEMSTVRQLGGSVTRDWLPGGLVVTARIPAKSFSRS